MSYISDDGLNTWLSEQSTQPFKKRLFHDRIQISEKKTKPHAGYMCVETIKCIYL